MTRPRFPITAHALATFLDRESTTLDRVFLALEQAFTPPSREFPLPFETVVGEMSNLEAPPPELDRFDTRLLRIALSALRPIEADLRAAIDRYGPERVALLFGSSTGGMDHTERLLPSVRLGREAPARYDYDEHHPIGRVADVLARWLGVRGPRYTVSTACSSSAKIFGTAYRMLSADVVDAVVVGGADSLCLTTLHGFNSLGALSRLGTRPFGRERDGITLSEGAGFALLEASDATTSATAWLGGVGESSDAYHGASPDPEGRGAFLAMGEALKRAGISPATHEIGLVLAHGTGTELNDRAEAAAIRSLLGSEVPVTAPKSSLGHLLGASGVASVIVGAETLRRRIAPATLGAPPIDSDLSIPILTRSEPTNTRAVLVNAFAFGGINTSVVLTS